MDANENIVFLTVLDDNDTYSDIHGSSVMMLTSDDADKMVEEDEKPSYLAKKVYDLTNPVHLRILADEIERLRGL